MQGALGNALSTGIAKGWERKKPAKCKWIGIAWAQAQGQEMGWRRKAQTEVSKDSLLGLKGAFPDTQEENDHTGA